MDMRHPKQPAPWLLLAAAIAGLCPAHPARAEPPSDHLLGNWQGTLKVGPAELRLVFAFERTEAGELTGTLTSIDQSPVPIPLSEVGLDDQTVTAAVPAIGGSFTGRHDAQASTITGTWRQAGAAFPLTLNAIDSAPTVKRPQEPKPPFPYEAVPAVVDNDAAGVRLAGTLTVPRGAGPHPAVVLISGSGPQDRNEEIMGHKPFAVIADHLTRQGVAVLRMDDRGVGESTGDFALATHDDFVTDAIAAIDWLKQRPGINPQQIGLVGHSEGGVVAPIAAVTRPDDVAFVVMLAGVGVPMQELLAQQGEDISQSMGLTPGSLSRDRTHQQEFYRLLRNEDGLPDDQLKQALTRLTMDSLEELSEEDREKLGVTPTVIAARLETVMSPWFRHLAQYDPGPTLERVRCPLLALNGELDVQVAADANLDAIRAAAQRGGNRDVTTTKLTGLSHLFQQCETGAIAGYGKIEQTFAPKALDAISAWILGRVDTAGASQTD